MAVATTTPKNNGNSAESSFRTRGSTEHGTTCVRY
uniref:Uncharacterized protein n=1 Tax=Arundo donax TaxID=35708 RepID=A0A0A8ZHH4_ARUDO